MPMSRSTRAVAVSAVIGITVIGLLAIYFRRKKPDKTNRRRLPLRNREDRLRYSSLSSIKSPLNGDVPRSDANSLHSGSPAPVKLTNLQSREPSEVASSISTIVGALPLDLTDSGLDQTDRSPANLCQLGLESIQRAINLWEAAINEIDDSNSQDGQSEVHDLRQQIEQMIERAYVIQEDYERIMFHQSTTVALDSALSALSDLNRIYEREHRTGEETESDTESFVSASEMPDLSDLEEKISGGSKLDSRKMYDDALFAVRNGVVPHRVLRTRMLNCDSDADFLAKLHCVRQAFGVLMTEEKNRDYFTTTGRDMLIKMIRLSGKETSDFEVAFDSLMEWVKSPDNWSIMEQELKGRGVKQFTFYDVVLDFILMDSFDDLASPPSSVTTITHNRWLSTKFKETALTTAVWSVLKAKRRMLGSSGGFIAKFYDVSEIISPTLAWGFLGPVEELNDLCYFFKDLICDFIVDIFDFNKVSYYDADRLSRDIMFIGRERAREAISRLTEQEQFLLTAS